MFGIGGTELIVIAIVLLIAVGPDRLPKLLKAVVKGYREFRRATRELRASTGIDEILQDEDLRDLRKPLYVPPPKQKVTPRPAKTNRSLSYAERIQEVPPEGVDLAEAQADETQAGEAREGDGASGDAAAEKHRAEKVRAEKIRAAKLAEADAAGGEE